MAKADAGRIVGKIRAQLKTIDNRICRHPYIKALEAGEISKKSLQGFAGHQFHIIGSDLRSIAQLINRHGTLKSRGFLVNLLQGEAAAFEALLKFGRALGLSETKLAAYEPAPAGVAYAHYVAWLGCYGSDAELAGAFLVNFAAWGANCARMGKALRKRYKMKDQDLFFFDLFAETPPEFEKAALGVISVGLARGIQPRLIVRAARLLQGFELLYWDTMAEI
ncbi:MAG: hypothetical protein A3F83_01045 [Candidatus Glassbacteria bacterium RIFCSPLOWO2_12_FULL_58_11]|uniref:Thiaminase-2/PQQC domain-containing protein n=1 Tax=Candidatus Glassbacteria bacterium RIFCSPLOWO2_12_FULL_58_11 TaxID=1817867 RepID=A0A1F5YX75_9BACT|nr:MAG: hypothetical protein A3F83_01045 [Candidatus Glassbacteria bacterium RIFCSPLOWO2_12_FULL_58_11]